MTNNNPEPTDETNYYDADYQGLTEQEWDEEWAEVNSLFTMYEDAPEFELCPSCDGLGCDNWDDDKLCQRCGGEGELPVVG